MGGAENQVLMLSGNFSSGAIAQNALLAISHSFSNCISITLPDFSPYHVHDGLQDRDDDLEVGALYP